MSSSSSLRVAIGPCLPGTGSWEWLGADLAVDLSEEFDITFFRDDVPACDVVIFVKDKPSTDVLRDLQPRAAIVFCPVDSYGSAEEIDGDESLLLCDRVVVHAPSLAKYFRSYAKTIYLDHPLKFIAPIRDKFLAEGPVLWVGARSNLPLLAKWLSTERPSEEIWILTNPERPDDIYFPKRLGLPADLNLRVGI